MDYETFARSLRATGIGFTFGLLAFSCGNDSSGTLTATGQECSAVSQCYPGVNQSELSGEVTCLTRVMGGYCTHTCTTDDDCCAFAGECRNGNPELCAPFESTNQQYCFLSCEASVVTAAGFSDASAYCSKYASVNFGCRSTGGGSENRKICAP